jgi:hypothetical protein
MRRNVGVLGMTAVLGLVVGAGLVAQSQGGTAPAAGRPPQQQVLPPEARYWMGATTGGGMLAMGGAAGGGRPSMGTMMKMASGGLPTESRTVLLKLGSTLPATKGEPEAFHTMPKGAEVNKPIYLETPQPGRSESGTSGYTPPKGKITFYWGCGEKAGPGQPVVLTFDKLMRGENDPELAVLEGAVSGRAVSRPSPGNSKTYGDWPHGDRRNRNRDLQANFPTSSTLVGQHVIEANYAPKIEFTLGAGKSFMEPVRYTSSGVQPSGAVLLSWAANARATGYSVGVMAPQRTNDESADIVMWSSAERPATFIQMEDLTPTEVNRLVGLKAVLPPATTTCAIPAEVVKATKEGSMLMFTAFGDEATFIHPARPANPAVTWDQEWFSRVSFKSVRMDLISPTGVQDLTSMAGTADPNKELSDEEYCKALAEKQAKPSVTSGIPGGRLLGRAFGGRREEPPPDPRCAKKN